MQTSYHVHDSQNVRFNVFIAVIFGHFLVSHDERLHIAFYADRTLLPHFLVRPRLFPLLPLAKWLLKAICQPNQFFN